MPLMPFGTHRGKDIQALDSSYLLWLLEKATWWQGEPRYRWLYHAIVQELRDRLDVILPPPWKPTPAVTDLNAALKTWYREATLRYHPDRCDGRDEAMKAITYSNETLRRLLKLPPK